MKLSQVTEPNHLMSKKLCVIFSLLLIAVFIRACGDINRARSGQRMLPDDAYYYLVVARNFAGTGAMTFDGFSATNGYHPFMFWIEVLMYLLGGLRLSAVNQVLAVICIQQFIFIGTVCLVMWWIYHNWTTHPFGAVAALLGLILFLYPTHVSIFVCGMESVLLLPFLLLFLLFVWQCRWNWAGLVAILLVMSRLDTSVYIVFPVVLIASLRGKPSFWLFSRRCLQMGGPPMLAVAILMAVYKIIFGHATPISGVCKSSFPIPHTQWHLITNYAVLAVKCGSPQILAMINPFTATVILIICGVLLYKPGFLSRIQRKTASLLVILGLFQLFNFLFFQKWAKPVPIWYYAGLVIFCSGSIGAVMTNLINRRALVTFCLAAAFILVILSGLREYKLVLKPVIPGQENLESFVNAQPKGVVFAATDCGSISFWTGARFVNLDGVINGFKYQAALRERKLKDYLREAGVRYLAVGIWQHEQIHFIEPMYVNRANKAVFDGDYKTFDFRVYSYMYGSYSDNITLHHDQEVWRGKPSLDGTTLGRVVVFDLSQADVGE